MTVQLTFSSWASDNEEEYKIFSRRRGTCHLSFVCRSMQNAFNIFLCRFYSKYALLYLSYHLSTMVQGVRAAPATAAQPQHTRPRGPRPCKPQT